MSTAVSMHYHDDDTAPAVSVRGVSGEPAVRIGE